LDSDEKWMLSWFRNCVGFENDNEKLKNLVVYDTFLWPAVFYGSIVRSRRKTGKRRLGSVNRKDEFMDRESTLKVVNGLRNTSWKIYFNDRTYRKKLRKADWLDTFEGKRNSRLKQSLMMIRLEKVFGCATSEMARLCWKGC